MYMQSKIRETALKPVITPYTSKESGDKFLFNSIYKDQLTIYITFDYQ